jgi:hypothetical protein
MSIMSPSFKQIVPVLSGWCLCHGGSLSTVYSFVPCNGIATQARYLQKVLHMQTGCFLERFNSPPTQNCAMAQAVSRQPFTSPCGIHI